ncbi:proteinase inhibitor-like [Alnus glutinosa]|uniref:proteinase inhibitor-like n=1 Tax=Alnus glutinosa TaxID=3517 RepID=UPI002D79B58E|nr:proteinase inhibitor-like [Alnus glutinosa]
MASDQCEGKNSWPELVGEQGTVAEATIERENSLVNAVIVEEGSFVTQDFRCDRVWVWVNENGTVCSVPTIG